MGFFSDSGGYEDPVGPAWQGAKNGVFWGAWLGMALGLVLKIVFIVLIAALFATWDGLVSFANRVIAGLKASNE